MKLINTDGMAFIGPGSEWFWTAISGIVLAVTFIAIYRQLSIARSTRAREELASLDREWSSERQMRYRLEIFVALRDGADPAHLPHGAATGLMNWWEIVAQLARSRDLGRKALYAQYRVICQRWWLTLAPQVRREREELGDGAVWADFEWLAGTLVRIHPEVAFNQQSFDQTLGDRIIGNEPDLRGLEAMRTVIVASQPPTG